MDIPLLFHDKYIAVCLKPPGADSEADMPALLAAALRVPAVSCVHRLDRAVGGVMVYALQRESSAALSREIADGRFHKEYRAVVHGRPEPDADTLRDLLFHDRGKNKSFVVRRARAGVKEAVLDYRVLGEAGGMSLMSVRLHTGRTHQIRVQFAARRHPLVGDGKYGSPRRDCAVALYSHELAFCHPQTGEALCFRAPRPQGFPWDLFQEENAGGETCDTLK